MSFGSLFSIIIGSIFINNVIFAKFLGCCPFMGVSKKVDASLGMGMAVTFVITIASAVTWLVYHFLLAPFGLGYLQTIAFILIIAALVQFVEMESFCVHGRTLFISVIFNFSACCMFDFQISNLA